jgi:hypothetical protein
MRENAMFIVMLAVVLICAASQETEAGWALDGAPVCVYSGDQEYPVICSDGAGGAIMAWEDRRDYPDIWAQRVDEMGRRVWAVAGVPICTASFGQLGPRICSDGAGGAIIAWTDPRASNVRDIYAQRIDPAGTVLWTANGVPACTETGHQHLNDICADGFGGAILVWQDERSGNTDWDDLYCQRIDADGNVLWDPSGVPLRVGGWLKEWARVVPDGGGGAIFSWIDWETSTIRAQRVNAVGAVMWTENGEIVRSASGTPYEPEIVSDGSGGAVISWTDHRDWYDAYAQRVDSLGNMLWTANGVAVTTDPVGQDWWQHHIRICGDGAGGATLAWVDQRFDGWDCYAQRVNGDGVPQWTENGIPVDTTTGSCDGIDLLAVSDKGAIIFWEDSRSGMGNDIYAQRVDSLGNTEWTENGEAICTAEGSQDIPHCTTDGMDGAIVAWEDERIFMDVGIFAHRITGEGEFVATLLQDWLASFRESEVVIEWRLAEIDGGALLSVSRARLPGDSFIELPYENLERDGLSFVYRDRSFVPGESYIYRVDAETETGRLFLFVTDRITPPAGRLTLHQNHPNPFNPATAISYYLPRRCRVLIVIYDLNGAEIRRLVSAEQEAGPQRATWNGTNEKGEPVSTGLYFYRITAGKESLSRKMILLR